VEHIQPAAGDLANAIETHPERGQALSNIYTKVNNAWEDGSAHHVYFCMASIIDVSKY